MTDQANTEVQAEASSGAAKNAVLNMGRGGILGVKAGMTQVYNGDGDQIAVTVIELKPSVITQVRTKEKNGYQAVQVGFLPRSEKSATKAEAGHAKASGHAGFYYMREFRFGPGDKLEGLTVGQVLSPEFIKEGDLVDVQSMSKGKGFQGGMKRYHMAGGFKSHGASVCHRSLGSIGNRADPGKCWKNKKMPGNMGHLLVTVQNMRVIKVDAENGLVLVNGSVPGPRSGIVTIRRAIKNLKKTAAKQGKK